MRSRTIYTAYVPHGINEKEFRPIKEGDKDFDEFSKFREQFLSKNNVDFVLFWNNRNIRRKQPGDVILSFRHFCDKLPKDKSSKVALFMHTQIADENGTDLKAVKDVICPNYKIVFSDEKISTKQLNFFYNLSDVTINIASNEGFGLSGAESIMTGTPIINNVTGGLQDHCRFEDDNGDWINFDSKITSNHTGKYKKYGVWCKPVFPTNRSLQGSIPTPYIFDDRCRFEDVADAIMYWYSMEKSQREEYGMKGREWAISEECGMSSKEMCNRFKKHINFMLDNWEKEDKFSIHKSDSFNFNYKNNIGITYYE